jgi:hypothetical protein
MAHATLIPEFDGWYWAIRSHLPERDCWLELVFVEAGAVVLTIDGEEDGRPGRWRFYAGPIEPPRLS